MRLLDVYLLTVDQKVAVRGFQADMTGRVSVQISEHQVAFRPFRILDVQITMIGVHATHFAGHRGSTIRKKKMLFSEERECAWESSSLTIQCL
ncbi:hypothetical protein [Deinococcus ruber]|uniref:Uncharacterized protein n=1 Tax=Deinococcus ruber TaxID=1848197 RepID=A0A918CIT6_9DEIO|nr:hypothetical protein [Deinococcus ruber]GGR26261.1 hypothetical protein GCM10008957_42260 [Deinococcus ruber]